MGREKDTKEEGKGKRKQKTSKGEDAVQNGTHQAKENEKPNKKVKTESEDRSITGGEPEDQDFVGKKKGVKRKRTKEESAGPGTHKSKKKKHKQEEESDVKTENKKAKRKSEKAVKKEEGEHSASKKAKRTKEEITGAKLLKIQKKEEEEKNRWRWWEEEKYENGVKWRFLEHKGPYFPPEYEPLPSNVQFYYDGKPVKLSTKAEEVAMFFAQMLDHEYTTKAVFRENFFADWRKIADESRHLWRRDAQFLTADSRHALQGPDPFREPKSVRSRDLSQPTEVQPTSNQEMSHQERTLIKVLDKCDFGEIHAMHKAKVEARKNLSKEEKLALKEANQKITDEYGFCLLDHHKERIGNFKIEPPGLFRGRGEHPKQGMLKKRIHPEDVIINCSKESKIPEPPAGHHWKEVRHDNSVTWLASWTENIQGSIKYVMLNANSKLKGEKDWEKYEVARKLKTCVKDIRNQYQEDFKSKTMETRQRAVALYFIDKLALRAGNEKEEGETADTVGCCSLRVEHITLHTKLDGNLCVVEFDFLGKDSIRYYNKVPVLSKVFKNLKLFMKNKRPGDDLFDRLNTALMNKHLSALMPGLTAKVFRTYNASITLQEQLKELSNMSDNMAEKLLSYNRANRAVAILCNHQRAPPKTFEQSMANLQAKIDTRKEQLSQAKSELKQAKKDAAKQDNPEQKMTTKAAQLLEKKEAAVKRCKEQLLRMEVQATDREENKQIALGTSKLNYLDPRISVAWSKNLEVPLEKIYNKTQRDKFAWAIDMTESDFVF